MIHVSFNFLFESVYFLVLARSAFTEDEYYGEYYNSGY